MCLGIRFKVVVSCSNDCLLRSDSLFVVIIVIVSSIYMLYYEFVLLDGVKSIKNIKKLAFNMPM